MSLMTRLRQRRDRKPRYKFPVGKLQYIEEPRGRIGRLLRRFRPAPEWFRQQDGYVEVSMPHVPSKDTWLRRLLHLPLKRARRGYIYKVYEPKWYWKAVGFKGKCLVIGQFGWKSALGYGLNFGGFGFYVALYYAWSQNPGIKSHWDAPAWIASAGLLSIWTFARHNIVRDAAEWTYRATFAWLAFTDPMSKARQSGHHSWFARLLAKLKVVPTTYEPKRVRWYWRVLQWLLSPITVLLASLPGYTLVFGPLLLVGLAFPGIYDHWLPQAPKYAGIVGTLFFGRYVFTRLAILAQEVLIDAFDDHGRKLHWPVPAPIRSYQRSGTSKRFEGRGRWRLPLVLFGILTIAVGCYVGYWIYGHVPYLKVNSLFTRVGFQYMLQHPIWHLPKL